MLEKERNGITAHAAYQCLRFLDVLMTKEKLTVEIAKINRIQINDDNLSVAHEDNVFQ